MNETIALSIQLHLFFIYISFVTYAASIYYIRQKNIMKIKAFSTHTLITITSVMFTGLIVMAMAQFNVSMLIWAMIPLWLYLIAIAAKRAFYLKRTPDNALNFTFLSYSLTRDFILYILTTIILFVVY